MKHSLVYIPVSILALFLSSCDSPELVRKRDKQALEITRLKSELALTEEKVKSAPADRSDELLEIEALEKVQQEEITRLETEVADLEAKKQAIEKEFSDYKTKYVIR